MTNNHDFFPPSELIINPNGSIYHLHLKPNDIAETILTVGDPNRVEKITQYFDEIILDVENREFKTQTGFYKGKKLTVISTGIGTGNIDVVLNELDALVNIDFETRQPKLQHTSLNIIRLGTSGSIQESVPIDSVLISEFAIGLDGLLHFYDLKNTVEEKAIITAFLQNWTHQKVTPYCIKASDILLNQFSTFPKGITATAIGVYAPQGRQLLAKIKGDNVIENLHDFSFENQKITNLEQVIFQTV